MADVITIDYRALADAPACVLDGKAWSKFIRTNATKDLIAMYRETGNKDCLAVPLVHWMCHDDEMNSLFVLEYSADDPRALWDKVELTPKDGIVLAYINAAGNALIIVAQMLEREGVKNTLLEHQAWLTNHLDIGQPILTTSPARAFTIPCKDDILFEDKTLWLGKPMEVTPIFEKIEVTEEPLAMKEPPEMPPLVQMFVDKADPKFKAATVLAMLPMLGALATDLRMTFVDGEVHSPSFMTCICAPQACGKSFIRRIFETLMARLIEEDAVAWEEFRQWEEQRALNMQAAKKIEGFPTRPSSNVRIAANTLTENQLLFRLLYSDGLHMIGYWEEIDTLIKNEKGGAYTAIREIFREAFDNAKHGRDVSSVGAFKGIVKVFLNFVVSGTPLSVKKFYNNAEDGLVSRTIFWNLPVTPFDPTPMNGTFNETEKAAVRKMADYLMDLKKEEPSMAGADGKIYLDAPEINSIWREWRRINEGDARANQDLPKATFLKRASVIAWRACHVLWLLWGIQKTVEKGGTRESVIAKLRDCFFWIADTVLEEQVKMFGAEIERHAEAIGTANLTNKQVFERLDDVFTYDDVLSMKGDKKAVSMLIKNWRKNNKIISLQRGVYKKN